MTFVVELNKIFYLLQKGVTVLKEIILTSLIMIGFMILLFNCILS